MELKAIKSSAGAKRLRSTPSQRAAHLAAWKRSGQSAAVYARAHGLHARNLYAWRSQREKSGPPASAFIPVQIGEDLHLPQPGVRITLKVDGVQWVIEGTMDMKALASMAGALKREVLDV